MRALINPTFKRLLALASGAAFTLAMVGCAREKPPLPPMKTSKLFVDQVPRNPSGKKTPDKTKKAAKTSADQGPQLKISLESSGLSQQKTDGVTLNWVAKEGTQMTSVAKSVSFNEVAQTGTLLDFSAKLYENDKLTASMKAPKAVADTNNRVVTAMGGVTLKSLERQTTVRASWMKWYANAHKVVGDGGVEITSPNGTITGAAFVADTSMRTLTVKDSAKGIKF